MKQYIKPIIGVLLIVLAIGAAYYWEKEGREFYTTEEVIVANSNILQGQVIDDSMLKRARVLRENIASGAITPGGINDALGKVASHNVTLNSQITKEVIKKDTGDGDGLTAIEIKGEWIYSLGQSLRNGDYVDFYTTDGEFVGSYKIGFVRDGDGMMVSELEVKYNDDLWKRGNATGIIKSIDIMSTATEYFRLLKMVNDDGKKFVIIQKRGI